MHVDTVHAIDASHTQVRLAVVVESSMMGILTSRFQVSECVSVCVCGRAHIVCMLYWILSEWKFRVEVNIASRMYYGARYRHPALSAHCCTRRAIAE